MTEKSAQEYKELLREAYWCVWILMAVIIGALFIGGNMAYYDWWVILGGVPAVGVCLYLWCEHDETLQEATIW